MLFVFSLWIINELEKNTALLSQALLSMVVVVVTDIKFSFFKVLVTDFFGSVHSVEISNSSATDVEQESLCRYFFCHTEKQLSEIQKGF